MDNQQVPKADSQFQKIVGKNYKKWKLRLLSKGGQKASSGGSPYKEKPDYKMGKSAPPGFGGSMEESEQLDEVIRKKSGKYCLFSKKTKRNLGCYSSKAGAMKRERQVQYFKHLKESIIKEELEQALLEEDWLDDLKSFGSSAWEKIKSVFDSDKKEDSKDKEEKKKEPEAKQTDSINISGVDPKADLSLSKKELIAKFGGFNGYIEFLWKLFDENKSSVSGWTVSQSIDLIKQIAPKYGLPPHIAIGVMKGESGLTPTGIYSQTMRSKGDPQAAIRANSTAYGMGGVTLTTYEGYNIKSILGVPHYMIWIPKYGIEASIITIAKNIKAKGGDLERAMRMYAGTEAGGQRKMELIAKAEEQYGSSMVSENKKLIIKFGEVLEEGKKGKEDRCVRIAKRKYKAWPSAYASGAVVKCRQGKIWKNIKEEEELEETKKPSKAKHLAKKGVALAAAASTMLGAKDQEKLQKSKKAKTEKHIVAEKELDEKWSEKYKKSIDCKNPKGFSQKAHCQGRKKRD